MKEAYCSYEIAKLLKEKGFDERTIYHYIIGQPTSLQHNIVYNKYCNSDAENIYVSPTHQMACAWLREVHNIFILVGWNPIHKEYFTSILNMTDSCPKRNIHEHANYEDAIEEVLKYTLENLI